MDLYDIRNQLNSGKSIYDIPMDVTFYARVSTDKYEQANSLKNQVDYFTEMIGKNKNWNLVEGYIDEGISGTSVNKRDAFLKMLRDAERKKFDFVITKEISRFSRNTLDSIKYTQELLRFGVGIFFQTDNINTFYADAELRLTIMSSIAQEEVRKLSERVKFGFKRSIENGRVLGNNSIWGYKKDEGKLVVDEEQAKIIQHIFEMYASQKMSVRGIGKALDEMGYKNRNGNQFNFTTIRNIITNPKYKGYYCGNKTRIIDYRLKQRVDIDEDDWVLYKDEESVPAIVSEELWEQANRILKMRSEKTKNNETGFQSRYRYSGKIFCSEHNVAYHRAIYKYKSGNKEVWQCKLYREGGKAACATPTLYTHEIDLVVKSAFESFVINRASIISRMIERYRISLSDDTLTKEIDKKENEIQKLHSKKDKILELLIDDRISKDEFTVQNDKYTEQMEEIKAAISKLKNEKECIENTRESIKALNDAIAKKLDFSGDDDDIEIINEALEKIVVHKGDEKNKVFLELFFRFNNRYDVSLDRKNGQHHFVIDNTHDKSGYRNRGKPDCWYGAAVGGTYTLPSK